MDFIPEASEQMNRMWVQIVANGFWGNKKEPGAVIGDYWLLLFSTVLIATIFSTLAAVNLAINTR